MTLVQAFEKYKKLAKELQDKVFEYAECFQKLDNQFIAERVLNEKVEGKEKEDIEKVIIRLETDIQTLFDGFSKHVEVITRLLKKEWFLDLKVINTLNREHIGTIFHYDTVITQFKVLKKYHKEYDFDSVIDFSKMENQKRCLNIAIKNFNRNFLSNVDIQLLDVYECEEEVFQIKEL